MTMETPLSGKAAFLRKKIGGVPVVYLAGGGALILSVVAWRTVPSPGGASVDPAVEDVYAGSDAEIFPDTPKGTVVVAPEKPDVVEPDLELTRQDIPNNDVWLQRGINFLTARGIGGGEAQAALATYLEGTSLSFAQGALRDQVIKELGPPPVVPGIGGTAPKPDAPAARQGVTPLTHRVRGSNDNTYLELSMLYYGSNHPLLLQGIEGANGGVPTPFPVGAGIKIPKAGARKYYKIPDARGRYPTVVAQRHGLTVAGLYRMNPGINWPVDVGRTVRVA
jgi:hypothetical protein